MVKIDMKLPKSCYGCLLLSTQYIYSECFTNCSVLKYNVEKYDNKRHPNCPLVEIKEGDNK